jgi:hypothetical protein
MESREEGRFQHQPWAPDPLESIIETGLTGRLHAFENESGFQGILEQKRRVDS